MIKALVFTLLKPIHDCSFNNIIHVLPFQGHMTTNRAFLDSLINAVFSLLYLDFFYVVWFYSLKCSSQRQQCSCSSNSSFKTNEAPQRQHILPSLESSGRSPGHRIKWQDCQTYEVQQPCLQFGRPRSKLFIHLPGHI